MYNDLALYNISIPVLDDPPSMEELVGAINSRGKGVSFVGLPPEILQLLPNQLKEVILKLIVNVYFGDLQHGRNKYYMLSLKMNIQQKFLR